MSNLFNFANAMRFRKKDSLMNKFKHFLQYFLAFTHEYNYGSY